MIVPIQLGSSLRSNGQRLTRAFLFAVVFLTAIPGIEAAELWDFVKVGKDLTAAPRWEARSGKAEVEIQAGHVKISAYYNDNPRMNPAIEISGTLGANGVIKATCTILNTDATPFQLSGRFVTRRDLQIWGTKRKIVTLQEIVFSHPPNSDFYGFLSKEVRDE
jgi:hypothetical protein